MSVSLTLQPISMLPVVAEMIRGEYDSMEELYSSLKDAQKRPYLLDDECVRRTVRLCHNQAELLLVSREQVLHWLASDPRSEERDVLQRLLTVLQQHETLIPLVLTLAEALQTETIDTILRMGDEEAGLAIVEGRHKPPSGAPVSEALRKKEQSATADVLDCLALEVDAAQTPLMFAATLSAQLPLFYRLMEISSEEEINRLCQTRPGLYRLASALESVAEGIQSGAIRTPPF